MWISVFSTIKLYNKKNHELNIFAFKVSEEPLLYNDFIETNVGLSTFCGSLSSFELKGPGTERFYLFNDCLLVSGTDSVDYKFEFFIGNF